MVEGAASRAAHLIEHAVEDLPALLVFVEPLIEKMTEVAAALRHAPADRVAQPRRRVVRGRVVLQETDQIARPRQAETEHARIRRPIDDVVNAPGLEPAIERDGA